MKKFFLLILTGMGSFLTVQAQYYYKDIILNRQLQAEMALLKQQKIRSIKVKSFDREDEPSLGFFCEKKIKKDYSSTEMVSASYASAESRLITLFNGKGQVTATTDSTDIAVGFSRYTYNDAGNLTSIASGSRSADDDFTNEAAETNYYYYNSSNQPERMVKVKQNGDSAVFRFTVDDKGNVTEEKNITTGKIYYYYYDTKNRLTDVVYYNSGLRKLLPVLMFEYNSNNEITQMVTAEEGAQFYYTWRYTYENGLKLREKCFYNRKGDPQIRESPGYGGSRNLQGIIEYEYR